MDVCKKFIWIYNRMDHVVNFRRVSDHVALYRYAALDLVPLQQRKLFFAEYDIRQCLDLRSLNEIRHVETMERPHSFAEAVVVHMPSGGDSSRLDTVGSSIVQQSIDDNGVVTFNVNFITPHYIEQCIWRRCPQPLRIKLTEMLNLKQFDMVVKLIGRDILGARGIVGTYCDMLNQSYTAIFEALKLVVTCLENDVGGGVGINCQWGRDRSGILVALIRHVLGDTSQVIIEDYAKSEDGLALVSHELQLEFASQGLGDDFLHAKGETMKQILEWLDDKFDGIDGYLDWIGFDCSWRDRLVHLKH